MNVREIRKQVSCSSKTAFFHLPSGLPLVHNFRIMLTRPAPTEYASFYAKYIARVPDTPIVEFLETQFDTYHDLLGSVPEHAAGEPLAAGKWSVKEVMGHLCDTERVMSYRALRFARGDSQELPGFEQDDYVRAANFNSRTRYDLYSEMKHIRCATVELFRNLSPEAALLTGTANKNPVSVRALAYIIGGHAQHHFDLLEEQLGSKSSAVARTA